ncbi:hypothetical protein B5F40_02080 [Gordonibacter sp. An230]|uniref:hypothetical protein n=1 Tax=Gordonibacter sp. An230 TaxID=1965592 RepID=UPI000B36BC1B|nr:hypothetical protein [Gordonibacter sp. An230]OUO92138.1 hypothetical protein B5F40_02080 [Gordonibacter sp. An230]
MSASIHPSVRLNIVLDEESYREGGGQLARRFGAVAPTEVVQAAKGSQRANVLRFDVGDDAVTAEDDALWRDALASWLDEEFAETSALVARENDARRANGTRPVPFTWAEVKFGTGPVIAVRMKGSVIPEEAAGFVARARVLLAAGAFGADAVAAIRIPACASIAAQRANAERDSVSPASDSPGFPRYSGREERGSSPVRDAEDAVEGVTGAGSGVVDEGSSIASDGPSAWNVDEVEGDEPTRSEIDAALAEAEEALRRGADPVDIAREGRDAGVRRAGWESAASKDARPSFVVADPNAEACALVDEDVPESLDYRIWNVAYADGTSVRYDSVLGEALLD